MFHVEQITGTRTVTRENSQKAFARACRLIGLLLSREQLALLESYVDLLVDWNSKVNLVSRSGIGKRVAERDPGGEHLGRYSSRWDRGGTR